MARHNGHCKRNQQILDDSFLSKALLIATPRQWSELTCGYRHTLPLPILFKKITLNQEVVYYG